MCWISNLIEAAGTRKKRSMAEGGVRTKRIRGAVRSATTRLLNKIDGELLKENPDLYVLEEFMEQLISKEQSLNEYDRDIEAAANEDDLDEEINTAIEYMDGISARKTRIRCATRIDGESSSASTSSQRNNGQRINTV